MEKLTERQLAVIRRIASGPNGHASADGIAQSLGYRPAKAGRLAVSSSLRSLMRERLVGRIAPADQWDHATYFLLPAGRAALEASNE